MTCGKRACKDMVKDTCNDMWGMLVRKYGRIPRYDLVEKIDKEEQRVLAVGGGGKIMV